MTEAAPIVIGLGLGGQQRTQITFLLCNENTFRHRSGTLSPRASAMRLSLDTVAW